MRKIATILALAIIIGLSGCSSSSAKASDVSSNEPHGKKVPAYFHMAHASASDAKKALESVGFEVLTEYKSKAFKKGFKKGSVIVFTNAALKAEGAKATRGHAAVMRMLVDGERKQLSVTNPVYFGKAFMQKEFNYAVFKSVQDDLKKAFPDMKPSKDNYAYDDLEGYHFMMGMPYYEDMIVIGEAPTAELVKKVDNYKKGSLIAFKLKLSDDTYVYGYDLDNRTAKFTKKTGTQNAEVLPYLILIENNQAKILNAKFYLAVSYPQLTMGEFMNIATVPGAIEKDLKKPFK